MKSPAFIESRAAAVLTVVFLFLLTFSLQHVSGASHKELAHAADEPAHVVTSLMIHDYLSAGIPEVPLRYAERYYAHYPKVAVGIWPPLVYTGAAIWMFVFGVSRSALLLLSGTVIASLASVLAVFVRRLYGSVLGIVAAITFIALRNTQWNNGTFMLDEAVALVSFAAMLLMERYFRTGRLSAAVALGLVTSTGMLVKGNANALILMIAFMLLATGRIDLLKKPGLYVTGLIVAVCGLPWQFFTIGLLTREQNAIPLTLDSVSRKALGYAGILFAELTPLITAFLVVGLIVALRKARAETGPESTALTAVACLFLAVLAFHCLVPFVGSLDPRYLAPALAPGIVLFLAGCQHISRLKLRKEASPALRLSLLIGCSVVSAAYLGAFQPPDLPALGFIRAADVALAANGSCCTMMVCSDATGEGAFISEVAMRDRRLSRVVLRGTKLISESSWNGQTFRMLFQNDEDLARALNANAADVVVVDLTATNSAEARALLLAALHRHPGEWNVVRLRGDFERTFEIYVRKERSGLRRDTIRVPMPFTLGHDIEIKTR
jgi:hypothetical protein